MKLAKQVLAVVLALLMAFSVFSIVGSAKMNATTTAPELWDGAGTITYGLDVYKVDGDSYTKLESGANLTPGDIIEVRESFGTNFITYQVASLIFYDSTYFVPAKDGVEYTTVDAKAFDSGFFKTYEDDAPQGELADGSGTATFYETLGDKTGKATAGVNMYARNKNAYMPGYMRTTYVEGGDLPAATAAIASEYSTLRYVYNTLTGAADSSTLGGFLSSVPYATYFSFQLKVVDGADSNGASTSIFIPVKAQKTKSNDSINKLFGGTSSGPAYTGSTKTQWGQGINVANGEVEFTIGQQAQGCEHTYTEAVTTPATCETAGVKTFTCSKCGESYTEAIPALGHDWDDGEITTPATCSAQGVKTFTCKNDASHTRTEAIAIDRNAHAWNNGAVTTAASCETEGVRTFTCLYDSTHTRTESIPAIGHRWNDGVETTPATCTTAGVKTFTCLNDATHTYTEAIPALGHAYGDWTFDTNDLVNHKKVCANNANHVEYEAHAWTETSRTPATATAAGSVTYTCSVCGGTKTETLAQTEANYKVTVIRVDADGNESSTTETKTGTIGDYVSLSLSDYETEEWLRVDLSKSTPGLGGEITDDGKLEITVYVDRTKATYTFMVNDTVYQQDEYRYGALVEAPLQPSDELISGYNFLGWKTATGAAFTGENAGTADVTIYANLEKIIDPSQAATAEELAALDAAIEQRLLDAVQLYYYTDEAILWVAAALGNNTTDADAFIQDAITNGYRYVGEKTSVAVNKAVEDIDHLMSKDTSDPTTLNAVDNSQGYIVPIHRDESKAHATITTIPIEVNGTAISPYANSLDIKAGDQIKFAFYIETDYYCGGFVAPIVYDCTKFKPVDTYGDAYDQDEFADVVDVEDFLDKTPYSSNRELKGHYDLEIFSIDSLAKQYPLWLRTNDEYKAQYKIFGIQLLSKNGPRNVAYKFDPATTGYICNFTMEAKEDMTYDGATGAVIGTIQDWYCSAAERDYIFQLPRVAGYLNDGTTPASSFNQYSELYVNRNSKAAALKAADVYSKFDETFTSVTTFGSACQHEWDDGEVTTPATCEGEGVMTYTCGLCGETRTEIIPAVGHDYVGAITTPATCEEDGVMTYTCKNDASHTYTEVIPATGHDYDATVIPATCEEQGYTLHVCKNNAEHTYRDNYVPALGHDWDDGAITTPATCEGEGVKTYTCKNDASHTRTEAIPALGHDWDDGAITTPATCEGEGVMTYTCKNDASHTRTEAIPATGHDWDEGTITTPATCEEDGVMTYTCKNDASHTRTEVIPAIGHDYDAEVVPPTCEDEGYTVYTCKNDPTHTYTDDYTDALGHDWDDGAITTPATCEGEGVMTYTCKNDASHTYTEIIPALGHDWDDGAITTPATCEEDGVMTYTCKNDASHTYTEAIPAIGHDWDDGAITTPATCEEDGVFTYTCKNDASHTRTEAIPAIGHDWDDGAITTPATCEEDGVFTYTCKNDASHTYTEAIPAIGHDWDDGAITTPATCKTEGVKTFTCKNDASHTRTEAVPVDPDAHAFDTEITAATCEEQGYTTYTCSLCGYSYQDDFTPAIGHDWGDWEDENETQHASYCKNDPTHVKYADHSFELDTERTTYETEYEDGLYIYVCSVCGREKEETVPATGHEHDWVATEVVPPTCEEQGYTLYVCSKDQNHTKQDDYVPATGHDWDEGAITTPATCEGEGVMTYTCKNDASHTYTEVIPATGHDYDATVIPATCEEQGYTLYVCKNNAEHTYTDNYVPALGHDWDDGAITTPATCEGEGVKTYTCKNDASHTYTEVIPALGHDWDEGAITTPATCEADGVKTFTCKNDASHTRTEVIPAIGHDYDDGVITTPATCETAGVKTFTCKNDASHTYTEPVPATGHDWDEGAITTPATCEADGVKTFTCKNDASHTRTEVIPAIGHDYDDGVITTPATCETAGVKTFTCKNDANHTYTEPVPATGHDWDDGAITTPATCKTEGVKTFTCKNDASHTRTEAVPVDPDAHAYDTEVTAPTCEEQGYTTYTCSLCGDSYQDDFVDAIGHDWDEGTITTPATCEEDGVKTFTCKNDANHTYTEPVPATGHDWDEGTITTPATCEEDGVKTFTCKNDANHTYTEPVPAIGHDYESTVVPATCETEGYTQYVCKNDATHTYTDNIVPALGHDWDDGTITTPATCEGEGVKTFTCKNDANHTYTEPIPAIGHDWDEGVVTKEPTYTEEGIKTYTCKNDPSHTRTEPIPRLTNEERDVIWAGYENQFDDITLDEGAKPAVEAHDIFVIAKGHPIKVQLRFANGSTLTFSKDGVGGGRAVKSVSDVVYNGVACELWVVDYALNTGAYTAIAKYIASTPIGDISSELGYTFDVDVPTYGTAVYSVKIDTVDPDYGYIVFDGSTKQVITVVTGVDVQKVQLRNDATNATLTYNSTNATIETSELDGTPVKVWTIERLFARGSYAFSVYTRSALGLNDSGKDLTFKVDAPSDDVVLVSVDVAYDSEARKDVFTVVTLNTVSKVKFTDVASGATITATKTGNERTQVAIAQNEDGKTMTWTITVNHHPGYTFDCQALVGNAYSSAKQITVPEDVAAPMLVSVSNEVNAEKTFVTFTVVTREDVSKLKLTNAAIGSTMTVLPGGTDKISVSISEVTDGQKTWTVTVKYLTAGKVMTYDCQAFIGTIASDVISTTVQDPA